MPQTHIDGWPVDPQRRCAASNRKGSPCGNSPVVDDRYCPYHDADTASGKARRDQRAAALRPAAAVDKLLAASIGEADPRRLRELREQMKAAIRGDLVDAPPADSPFWSLENSDDEGRAGA